MHRGPIFKRIIITDRKRSLGQGNIFTNVCQEFCSQGGCLVPGGVCGDPPPRDGYCCGRYASYWNAFLFSSYVSNCHSYPFTPTPFHNQALGHPIPIVQKNTIDILSYLYHLLSFRMLHAILAYLYFVSSTQGFWSTCPLSQFESGWTVCVLTIEYNIHILRVIFIEIPSPF